MHFLCYVVIEEPQDVKDRVGELLAPHQNVAFDWHRIGGRWAGILDPTYDPTEDPLNRETCAECQGEGVGTARALTARHAKEQEVS